MGAGMSVRKAKAGDVDEIIACIQAAYEGYRQAGIALPPVADGVAEDVRDNQVWVWEQAGDIAGVLIAVAGAENWHLANLAVDPAYAGRGLAKALLARMEDAAHAFGVTNLALTTHIAMPDNVTIYTRLGWIETGREGNKVFMARRLGDATKE
jgi:N-acetylglutamate synthase-like GNAT family acetyltransferase